MQQVLVAHSDGGLLQQQAPQGMAQPVPSSLPEVSQAPTPPATGPIGQPAPAAPHVGHGNQQAEFRTCYDIKASVLGPDAHQAQEVKILGRALRWTDGGVEYEAGARHREIVIREFGLNDSGAVGTPCGPEVRGCLPNRGSH